MVALLVVAYTTINIFATDLQSNFTIAVLEYTKNNKSRQDIIAYNSTSSPKLTLLKTSNDTILRGDRTGNYYLLYYNADLDCIVVDTQFDKVQNYYELSLGSNILDIVFYGNTSDFSTTLTITKKSLSDVNIPKLTIDDINNAINNSLNKTTQTTVTVNNIISNTTNIYNQYKTGDISYTDLIYNINNNVNQLNELNAVNGNTLADLISINNGLTYNQIIQDKALEDRNESFWNSKDISKTVAESTIADDNAQKEYLNELTQETTQKLSDFAISGKINEQAKANTVNILNVLYNNEILKLIIPIAATLMLVCIVLGIKYRL